MNGGPRAPRRVNLFAALGGGWADLEQPKR